MKEAMIEINKMQSVDCIKSGAFQAVLYKHKIRKMKKSDMYYELDNRPRYSQKFIDWFVKNIKQKGWLDSARSSYRASLKK